MSWDVLLLRLPDECASVQDLPDGWMPPPLGHQHEVLAAVTHAAPAAGLTDPHWGELCGPGWSMELNIGPQDPVESVMLHIRGGGDVLACILDLAQALACKALDCSTGDLLTPDNRSGWHAFQDYRDRATGPGL
ncbi:hypothetical protein ABT160_42395 [Streptomyces sp. NPDC001941]|uniref:hypothetical protein n=1 Tax=Streptomyces sp. NPDC001941 TaxID=3154659 RepID=UPI00332117B5